MHRANFVLNSRSRRVLRRLLPIVCGPGSLGTGTTDAVLDHVELTLRSMATGPRRLALLSLRLFDLAAIAFPPFGRTFTRLSPAAARRYYGAWWSSRQPVLRRIARSLKDLLVLGYYEQPDMHRKLEYNPAPWIARTALRRAETWQVEIRRHEDELRAPNPLVPSMPAATSKRPGRVYTSRDFQGGELACDVVVVGSGAGGAVVAAELAEGGLDVIVLEEGGYHRTEEFAPEATAMVRKLYRDGGIQATIGTPPISFAEGRCVGGSTTVNGGMCWRTPEKVLQRWSHEDGVEGILPAEMERYFQRVERFVSAAPQDAGSIGKDQELLRMGAERRGWHLLPNVRAQLHCGGCNNCVFGCPTGAKRSTLVSYIPRAVSFGAQVYAGCRVSQVIMRGKRAVGVAGHVLSNDRVPTAPFTVKARHVVVAAGAIQTPGLLLRSRIKSPSGRIGRDLTLHPNSIVTALFDEPVEGWKGVHQAYQVRQFQDEGIIMAAVNLPPSLLALSLNRYGRDLTGVMARYNHVVSSGVLVEDTGSGRVRLLPNGQPAAFYNLSDRDAGTLLGGTALLAELLFAAGARRVIVPFRGVPELKAMDDARRLHSRKVPAHDMELSTVHVMGTARMGGDPTRHVCDSYGKVYETEGLYVADAGLFPSPVGINPMETIMALATRNAERILETARR